jgi:branched-chain amino acid transport system substrate-binding protein
VLAASAFTLAATAAQAQDKEIVIGVECDHTGATQIVGTLLCPGMHDYIALVNSKGGVEGYKINAIEIDHEYKVPPAMEAHERFKKEGELSEAVYGTPQIAALNKKLRRIRFSAPHRALAPPRPRTASAIPTPSRSPPATGRRVRPRSSS